MIPSRWLGFLRRVFLANHLASNDNLARTTKGQNTHQRKLTVHKKLDLINNNTIKTCQDTRLVTFYDIRPENRAGLFLQRRSPHGA